jgi:hypothetical protein
MESRTMANEKTPTKAPAATPAATPKARKARKPVDPNETPDARFRRIGSKRLTRAVNTMRGIAQLGKSRARKDDNGNWKRNEDGSTSGYAYTPEQAEKIVQVLTDAVADVKRALAPRQAMKAGQELIEL